MHKGMIIKGIGGLYHVKTDKGIYQCNARGRFRNEQCKPLPGDWVNFDHTQENQGYITEILPRKNEFIRPPVSNITQAIIVVSIIKPNPDLFLVDKLLCLFHMKEINSVLCINKVDLATKGQIDDLKKQYEKTCPIICTSAKDHKGIHEIEKYLQNQKTVLAGQSGVGKSSILNDILGRTHMEVGAISRKIQRGKHTTRHAEFVEVGNGFLVDTPGFSTFEESLLDVESIKTCYNEFEAYESQCRFQGCMHIQEPHCAVKQAVKEQDLSKERYERYIELYHRTLAAVKRKRGY